MPLRHYLVLIRPANVITAHSDILAGLALSGALAPEVLSTELILPGLLLLLSTTGLYGGGIVFNDVFDYELDKTERPERPLPSGAVSVRQATTYGLILFLLGILAARLVSLHSALLAIGIMLAALAYDRYFKHLAAGGPLVMGMCRGLNLALGMSLVLPFPPALWPIAFLPLVFIGAITLTSQGEVSGGNKTAIGLALALDLVIAAVILWLGISGLLSLFKLAPFLLLWLGMNLRAKWAAIRNNQPAQVMNAVKTGVISLIPLNACYVAGSTNWIYGLAVLMLLPLSLQLSKKFAVT